MKTLLEIQQENRRLIMQIVHSCNFDKKAGYELDKLFESITLSRVLLAIQRSSNWLAFWMNCHGDMIYEKLNKTNKRGKEIKIRWNLTEPTLEKQTKETQRAIYGLLGGENE
jgi:hypothetical protein